MSEYHKICFGEVLGNHGITPTDELISDLISVSEMSTEYSGISEQTKGGRTEVDVLNDKIKTIKNQHEKLLLDIRTNYAKSNNCGIDQVIIQDGKLLVEVNYG